MKKLKAVTIVVFGFGTLCVLLAGLFLSSLEQNLQTWAQLQRAGMEGAQQISVESLRAGIISHSILLLAIGALSMVSGVGLFLLKEWARKLWLGMLVLLAVVSIYWFASDWYEGYILEPENVIGYPIIAVLMFGMWVYFTRPATKNRFLAGRPREASAPDTPMDAL